MTNPVIVIANEQSRPGRVQIVKAWVLVQGEPLADSTA